jgi:predicted enzyme related to lactoylglutathione lyase
MNTIVHFDVPIDDIERAKKFYTELFNWKIEKMPGPMEYYSISTTDEKGVQGIGGGMGKRGEPNQRIVNYIGVSSVDEYLIKVEQLGGKVLMPKTTVPGFGFLATCLDTENNVFGLWQSEEKAQ